MECRVYVSPGSKSIATTRPLGSKASLLNDQISGGGGGNRAPATTTRYSPFNQAKAQLSDFSTVCRGGEILSTWGGCSGQRRRTIRHHHHTLRRVPRSPGAQCLRECAVLWE